MDLFREVLKKKYILRYLAIIILLHPVYLAHLSPLLNQTETAHSENIIQHFANMYYWFSSLKQPTIIVSLKVKDNRLYRATN